MRVTIFQRDSWGLDLVARYSHLVGQDTDNIGTGDANTGLAELRLGLSYHLGGFLDSDGDGIADKYDVYPDLPEDYDGFQDSDGAPDLDNDKDGVPDGQDGAPDQPEDIDGFQDDDGVPDLDNDNDGIPDSRDLSPNEAEDMDGFEDEDGQPDLDNDNDGIPDLLDQCPNRPETYNGYLDEDGCPDTKPGEPGESIVWEEASVPEEGVAMVLEGITFESGSATLTEGSMGTLDIVFESLMNNPGVNIEIRGYTDAVGSAATNLDLSQRRADAVKNYLIDRGIDFNRLRSIGYGEASPIAPNDTPEGRAQNRRIEFIRIEH
jgi:outer membrane protein OmpA-like peptidoglycan-associated protein